MIPPFFFGLIAGIVIGWLITIAFDDGDDMKPLL
jgi:hypothetical protein